MYKLIDLPYTMDALEPVISKQTLEFHYGKHLQAYVDNLNKLLPGTGLEELPLEEIVAKSTGALFNNAGQVLNHNLYFTQFCSPSVIPSPASVIPSPEGASVSPSVIPTEASVIPSPSSVIPSPEGASVSPLSQQIKKQWGSLDSFKSEFEAKGVGLFGSGWVWLQSDSKGELSIGQYANADNPVAHGLNPLLTFDVWEHAYYLDYQNRRAAHLNALWQIVNWSVIEERYLSQSGAD